MHIPMYTHILIHINRFKANGELRIGKQKSCACLNEHHIVHLLSKPNRFLFKIAGEDILLQG